MSKGQSIEQFNHVLRDLAEEREEYLQRIPLDEKCAQEKNATIELYSRQTSLYSRDWSNSIFLMMNLLILVIFFILQMEHLDSLIG